MSKAENEPKTTNGLSSSPGRFTFQRDRYMERKADEGKTPENDEDVAAMFEYYTNVANHKAELEADPKWQENNMEYDLRSTDWIVQKVRARNYYAQNLYAAMCNNDFQKLEVMPILANKTWSCSWRYAGGIVADMKGEGDYIDWYCSGIRDTGPELDDDQFQQLSTEQRDFHIESKKYVSESVVTDEIREDLKRLGWIVVDNDGNNLF